MAATPPLTQPSNWAKREHRPPTKPHKDPLSRDYLTKDEVEAMIVAARKAGGRTADRDALLIMLAYRHGLRASELTAVRWDQVDLRAGRLHVAHLKHGDPSSHPLRGPELRAIRAWKRAQDGKSP
jgi:type 1 fimbriae regulatory protein FimE